MIHALYFSLILVSLQAQDSWFQRKCRLVNHSTSALSYLLPSFLSFNSEGRFGGACSTVCLGLRLSCPPTARITSFVFAVTTSRARWRENKSPAD